MKKLFVEEVVKCGVPQEVAERFLLIKPTRACVAWIADRLVDRSKVMFSLRFLADVMGLDFDHVHHAYYYKRPVSEAELRATRGFDEVMKRALLLHPDERFWLSLMRFCRKEVTQVMIGEMLLSGMSVKTIMGITGLSFRTIYRLREPFVVEFLKQKADEIKRSI